MDSQPKLSPAAVGDVLGFLRERGVRLWHEDGQLHYQAPQGALTQEEIQVLRLSKNQIIELLHGAAEASGRTCELRSTRCSPLTFSQLSYWHAHHLNGQPAVRQLALVTRLLGRLNIHVLHESVAAIVHQHDALRTRIVVNGNYPLQEVCPRNGYELQIVDLTSVAECVREIQIQQEAEKVIVEEIELSQGGLFAARLLRLGDLDNALIVAMEHMISDAFSMHVFMRDLLSTYRRLLTRTNLSCPKLPAQFPDYAIWQKLALRPWLSAHGPYWSAHLARGTRLSFPSRGPDRVSVMPRTGTVPLRIDGDLRAQLMNRCREHRTTLAMGCFAAYIAAMLRACNAAEAIFPYQTDGRVTPALQSAIGYFATVLYLKVSLLACDTFVDLMNRVKEEYCRAFEHYDFGYVDALLPSPEFSRNGRFNWISQSSHEDQPVDSSGTGLACVRFQMDDPVLKTIDLTDYEPGVVFFDSPAEVSGYMYFSLNRFATETIQSFGRNLGILLRALSTDPDANIREVVLEGHPDSVTRWPVKPTQFS